MGPGKDEPAESLPTLDSDRPGAAPPASSGAWTEMAHAFGHFVESLCESPTPQGLLDATVGLLHSFQKVQDAQAGVLRSIYDDVELLRAQPFETAQLQLRDAARVGPGDPLFAHLLTQASASLYAAVPMSASKEERHVVTFHLGVVYAMQQRSDLAATWLKDSWDTGHEVLTDLVARAGDSHVVQHKSTAALAALAMAATSPIGVGVVAARKVEREKHRKKVAAEKAGQALESILPSINMTATCFNALGVPPAIPTVDLHSHRGHLVLGEEGAQPT
jgi:hypothetical protein